MNKEFKGRPSDTVIFIKTFMLSFFVMLAVISAVIAYILMPLVDSMEKSKKIKVGDAEITPRDFLVKVVPSPIETAGAMKGQGCAGTWVTGEKDGMKRSVYLYQVADNETCMSRYGTNSVVAQTAVGPVIMMELVAKGIWDLKGVHGPESFDPDPFVERLAKYEFPAGIREMDSEYEEMINEHKFVEILK